MIEEKLNFLIFKFRGKISDQSLNMAIEYIDFNEYGVAFDLLCNEIYEVDIAISEVEYKLISEINHVLSQALSKSVLEGLKLQVLE